MNKVSNWLRAVLYVVIGIFHFSGSAYAQAPTVADLVEANQAFMKLDRKNTSIGAQFDMHFLSPLTINGTIWAYYIKWDRSDPAHEKGGVALAKSTDGVNFIDQGFVLRAGPPGSWDSDFATFPSVKYDNGIFYMAYEGKGSSPGDIGLATSSDGVNFTKQGIILAHNSSGWEQTNIGTPSLYKEGTTWYLHYHGFNGATCQIGVATGTDLARLTKHASNPIIPSIPNTWQSGTAGRRDITKVNGKYYMVYEGSGPQPYSTAKWSSGFATSIDLINWTLFSQNEVLPQTANTMGNDGPNFLSIGGLNYIYYRSSPTRRALIANESYGNFDQQWSMSSPSIGHVIGRAEVDGGWSVNVLDTPNNFMQFGPYAPMSAGEYVATWKLMVDNNTADNFKIVRLEVVDADAGGAIINQRDITRKQWKQASRYEYFSVPFRIDASRAGHRIEMRVFYYGRSYVKEKVVGVS